MLMALISRAIGAWFAFLLPAYNTFKALKHRPLPEEELEKLSMFWCVVGLLTAVEMAGEWLYSWFPFYYEMKTIFLLFLSLPQTQGSTWIYRSYVEPYLIKNEADIDASIAAAQTSIVEFAKGRFSVVWDLIIGLLNKNAGGASRQQAPSSQPQAQTPGSPQPQPGSGTGSQAPIVAGPWVEAAKGLWGAYGPSVVEAIQKRASGASSSTHAQSASPRPAAASMASSSSVQTSQGHLDPRQVPLPPSTATTPAQPASTPRFPEPQYF